MILAKCTKLQCATTFIDPNGCFLHLILTVFAKFSVCMYVVQGVYVCMLTFGKRWYIVLGTVLMLYTYTGMLSVFIYPR